MNLILIGFKKCGKSSLGKILAEKMKKKFIDVDSLIEQKYDPKRKFSYFEIYEKKGEEFFREIETKVIRSLISTKNSVIATGGGSLLKEKNADFLKELGKLLYLYLPLDVLKKRIYQGRVPPFLLTSFKDAFTLRDQIFSRFANYTIDAKDKSLEKICQEIIQSNFYGE